MSALQEEGLRSAAQVRLELWGDYALGDPWFLLLFPLGLAALWWGRGRSGRVRARVSAIPAVAMPKSAAQRLSFLLPLFQIAALGLTTVALSRPLLGNELQTTTSEGVDIALLIDRSSSMLLPDLSEDGSQDRLEVVKSVVADFATRRMTDREGNADNIALISFAHYPQVLCPFTLDVGALQGFLETIEIVDPGGQEDGTAIGIALAKAVAMLSESEAKSRVVVLLTDGENRIPDITPIQAAELAKAEGIRVHCIHAARYVYIEDAYGRFVPTDRPSETRELERVAEITGGRFFKAKDREGLEGIYAAIEELERTPREEQRYVETFDLYPKFIWPAILCYLMAWFASATWVRRLD